METYNFIDDRNAQEEVMIKKTEAEFPDTTITSESLRDFMWSDLYFEWKEGPF